jgi:hypothetical protein
MHITRQHVDLKIAIHIRLEYVRGLSVSCDSRVTGAGKLSLTAVEAGMLASSGVRSSPIDLEVSFHRASERRVMCQNASTPSRPKTCSLNPRRSWTTITRCVYPAASQSSAICGMLITLYPYITSFDAFGKPCSSLKVLQPGNRHCFSTQGKNSGSSRQVV